MTGARTVLVALLLGVLAAAPVQASDPVPEALAGLELTDQFGGRDSLEAHRGSVLVAVVVNVRRLALIEAWERDLGTRVPGIRFMNIADLPSQGPVDPVRTAATLRRKVPPDVAVLMDFDRHWAGTLALDTAVPNLLVFDARGNLTARFRGRWTAELAAEVAAAIAPLLAEAGIQP